jgi:hypothetical protein
MNELKMTYFTRYAAQYDAYRFYLKMDLLAELATSGSTVYIVLGFQNYLDLEKWDYVRMTVDYDGDARMPTNPFTIADLYSKNKAKDGCLDQQLEPDPKQDW